MGRSNTVAQEHCPHLSTMLPELWTLLGESEREQLLIWSSFFIFKKGEVIFQAHTIPQNLFILASGKVKIAREGYGDRTQILRMMSSGDFFGYHTHFGGMPYVTSAVAVEESVLCLVPVYILDAILRSNGAAACFFLQDVARKLSGADLLTMSLTQKHSRGRLAEALLMLIEKYGYEDDGETVSIYLSRQEVASLANMTTPNAIRTLYSLEEDGVLRLEGRRIIVQEPERLAHISDLG